MYFKNWEKNGGQKKQLFAKKTLSAIDSCNIIIIRAYYY